MGVTPVLNLSSLLHTPLEEHNPLIGVLQELKDGVLICNQSGSILWYNNALLDFFELPESILNHHYRDVIPNELLHISLDSVLLSGRSVSQELQFESHSIIKTYQIHIASLTMPQGKDARGQKGVPGCVAIFHDLTTIKQTEKMRRDFVANVSHELRTPLSAIRGYAETMLEGALDDRAVAMDFLTIIHNHSLRLSRLVEDLLDLSKLESENFQAELRPVNVKSMVHRIISMMGDNALSKNLKFYTDFPDDLPKVRANVNNLEQVLTNLLDNAVKYTPKEGRIAVSAFETEHNMIQINVMDTGIGIEAKHFPRIFERFYRVDKARSREMGGTGLGLSIVKHIIQLHGGEIWVTSTPNKGSTFSFTLRKASDDPEYL